MQVRAQNQTKIPPTQSTTCNFLFCLSSFFVEIKLTSPHLRSGLRCSRIEIPHCSLGTDTDKDMETQETKPTKTPHHQQTAYPYKFFLFVFRFFFASNSASSTTGKQVHLHCRLRTISLTPSTDANKDTETPPSHPPKQNKHTNFFSLSVCLCSFLQSILTSPQLHHNYD